MVSTIHLQGDNKVIIHTSKIATICDYKAIFRLKFTTVVLICKLILSDQFSNLHEINTINMGKGDKKTRRGKIANKSYGARRPKKIKKVVAPAAKKKSAKKKK